MIMVLWVRIQMCSVFSFSLLELVLRCFKITLPDEPDKVNQFFLDKSLRLDTFSYTAHLSI